MPLAAIEERARAASAAIALAEGADPRVAAAAVAARAQGLARPILIGPEAAVAEAVRAAGGAASDFTIMDPERSPERTRFAEEYLRLRQAKGATPESAEQAVAEAVGFAAMAVRLGLADGAVGGAVATTAATVRAALQIIGKAAGVEVVSSFFLMLAREGPLVFADCALVVEPSAAELAAIAEASADSFAAVVGRGPRVALLSFSTRGSARHAHVDRVAQARDLLAAARPDLCLDGEIQFDAAIAPDVAAAKAPGSPLEGRANVFVFPSLEAGNIGYKIAQRLGGVQAVGPALQGLAAPMNDLSRGCSSEDVRATIALTASQTAVGAANPTPSPRPAGSGQPPPKRL